jgi:hypothetical protein
MKRKNRELMLAMEIKIAGLEEISRRQNIALEAHRERLSDHDEALEAQGEDFTRIQGYTNARIESLENVDCRLRLEQLERTKDIQRDVSNRQAREIIELNKRLQTTTDRLLTLEEIYKIHNHENQKKSNLVMEKRPVGRPRPKVPK